MYDITFNEVVMKRPLCECGNLARKNGFTVAGKPKYKTKCSPCSRKIHVQGIPGARGGKYSVRVTGRAYYKKFKKDYCEMCGFVPIHECQLDVDHKNGDSSNNKESNFQTLCANCHRLKTFQNKDWKPNEAL